MVAKRKNPHAQRLQQGIGTSQDAAVLGRLGGIAKGAPKGLAAMSPAKRKRISRAGAKASAEARRKRR
jgi:hypothetical protein